MRRGCSLVTALLGLIALAFAALACGGGRSVTTAGLLPAGERGGVYLALGDSIAAGSGASDASATSYVALVEEALRDRFGEGLEVRSLAVGGHTTQDLIDRQLPAALELLGRGDVRLVTVTISGNDLNQLAAYRACQTDPSLPDCPIDDLLLEIEQRLDRILQALRDAGPGVAIAIQVYPNLFSGTGHMFERQAELAFGLLDGVIAGVAARHNVLVADPRPAFAGEGGSLTHLLDPTPGPHPNDAGYRAIAEAFLEVLGLSTADAGTD